MSHKAVGKGDQRIEKLRTGVSSQVVSNMMSCPCFSPWNLHIQPQLAPCHSIQELVGKAKYAFSRW